jgi:hypothetical protein
MSGDYKFHHPEPDVSLSMSADDLLGAAILTPSVHQQPLQSPMPLQSGPYQNPQYQQARSYQTQVMQPMASASIEPIHTQEAISGITSADVLPAMQQTSAIMALIPRIDTTSGTLGNVPYTGPHTAPILGSLSEDPQANPRLYHFGSDSNFDSSGFRPTSDFERHDFRAEQLTSELRRLKPINRTPDATRDPTPESTPNNRKRRASGMDADDESHERPKRARLGDPNATTVDPEELARTRARRASAPTAPRARRGGSLSNIGVIGGAPGGSATMSAAATARAKRENLNDEQKRQNHIASEQKRRNQIRIGFEELHRLVPDLQEGGLSKSNVLMESAAFLENLVETNRKLKQRLGYEPEEK